MQQNDIPEPSVETIVYTNTWVEIAFAIALGILVGAFMFYLMAKQGVFNG